MHQENATFDELRRHLPPHLPQLPKKDTKALSRYAGLAHFSASKFSQNPLYGLAQSLTPGVRAGFCAFLLPQNVHKKEYKSAFVFFLRQTLTSVVNQQRYICLAETTTNEFTSHLHFRTRVQWAPILL